MKQGSDMKRQVLLALAICILLPAAMRGQIGNIVVTNAASFRAGVPPPDSIGTIFCTGLAVKGVVTATGVPLPFSLGGVTVTIGGARAPLFAVADLGGYQQINFQVPLEAQFNTLLQPSTTQVVVSQDGAQGSATAATDPTTPGEFFRIGGTQYGVFQHTDYSLVTEQNPAVPHETIIAYLTGLPTAIPAVPTGLPAPADPLSLVEVCDPDPGLRIDSLDLQIGTFSIPNPNPGCHTPVVGLLPIPFIGLSPGSVGLYQINFVLADGQSGDLSLTIIWRRCQAFPGDTHVCNPSDQRSSQAVVIPVR